MAISDKIISFWKQVKLKSSDMFTLFKVGIGLKFPTHKLHVKDATDPIKVEGVQSDTSSSTKFLVLDGSDVVKHTTAGGKTTEEVQDIVGAMFTSNTETGIAATYEDSDGTIDLVVSGVTDLHTAGVDGAANQLLTDDGDGTVTSESHLTFASSTLELGGDTFDSFKIQRKDHSDNIGGELRIFSGAGGGTNKAGGDLIFKSGKGTGNALGGAIEFYVSTAGSSGDTAHFLQAIDMKITDGLVHVTGNITLTGTVDGIDIATDVAANTAKTGITTGQANAITANTAKVDLTVNGAGTIHSNNVPTLNQSTTGNATTATVASTSAITDAAAASTTYYPVLVDGFTGFQALEAESELTFVGNTGILTATGFAGALTGDVTGNADTATNLTAGDKSINGTFQSKGFIQDGDKSVTASSDGVAIHVDASDITDSSTSGSGTATTFNHVVFENPRLMATNSSVTTTNASTVYIKGAPVASTNQTITNAYSLYVAGGHSYFNNDVTVGGDVDITGNVLPGITYVKILPSDFMPDDGGRPAMIDDTGSDRWLESHGTSKLYAFVDIPVGFKATECVIYGSATSAITVYEADINSKTVTSKGTGNIGTPIDGGDFTHVNSDATNYILIELQQASGEEVYGGKLTIAKI